MALLLASAAGAATRFAAPGGTGPRTGPNACPPNNPCSLFGAAGNGQGAQNGDEVVVEPGTYSDVAGDLGPGSTLFLPAGIIVQGAAGKPRPVIILDAGVAFGGLLVLGGDRVGHLEIQNRADLAGLTISDGVVNDLVVRTTGPLVESIACNQLGGSISDSVCLSSARRGTALGTATTMSANVTTDVAVRSVTAVSTGESSFGVNYRVGNGGGGLNGPTFNVDARAVIADGAQTDVGAESIAGAKVHVTLAGSDYVNVLTSTDGSPGAAATATPAGTNGNIVLPPQLAADGFHQLPTSPTVGAGVLDDQSGPLDVDGQLRTIGAAPDIGADELGEATLTELACTPAAISIGGPPSSCTATVRNALAGGLPPRQAVSMSLALFGTGAGQFNNGGLCTLTEAAGVATCKLDYTPSQVGDGQHLLIASYAGDLTHDSGSGQTTVQVAKAPEKPPGGGNPPPPPRPPPPPPPPTAPETKLTASPRKKTALRAARFVFSTDSAGARFECRLDRKPFKKCASPFKAKVAPGPHLFEVRAVSGAGLVDASPAAYRWRVLRHR